MYVFLGGGEVIITAEGSVHTKGEEATYRLTKNPQKGSSHVNKKNKELKSDNRRKLNKIQLRYDQVHWWSLKLGYVSTAGASTPDTLNC